MNHQKMMETTFDHLLSFFQNGPSFMTHLWRKTTRLREIGSNSLSILMLEHKWHNEPPIKSTCIILIHSVQKPSHFLITESVISESSTICPFAIELETFRNLYLFMGRSATDILIALARGR